MTELETTSAVLQLISNNIRNSLKVDKNSLYWNFYLTLSSVSASPPLQRLQISLLDTVMSQKEIIGRIYRAWRQSQQLFKMHINTYSQIYISESAAFDR